MELLLEGVDLRPDYVVFRMHMTKGGTLKIATSQADELDMARLCFGSFFTNCLEVQPREKWRVWGVAILGLKDGKYEIIDKEVYCTRLTNDLIHGWMMWVAPHLSQPYPLPELSMN